VEFNGKRLVGRPADLGRELGVIARLPRTLPEATDLAEGVPDGVVVEHFDHGDAVTSLIRRWSVLAVQGHGSSCWAACSSLQAAVITAFS
jgi:hypothetical protein